MNAQTKPLFVELADVLWDLEMLEHAMDNGANDGRILARYEALEVRAGDLLARIREWTVS